MSEVTYEPAGEFHRALKRRVDEYFAGEARRSTRAVQLKSVLIAVGLAASYVLYLSSTSIGLLVLAGVLIGLAMAAVGFNIQHDGGHGTFARGKLANRLAAYSLDLLGGSSYVWRWKHNHFHHTYPNVDGVDADIDLGAVGRLSAVRPWRRHHRFQHAYLWMLYGLLPIKWQFFDDFRDVVRGRIGERPFPRPRGLELLGLFGGKLLFALLAFGLPLLRHDALTVIGVYVLASYVCGVTLSVTFQLAHVVDGVLTPLPPEEVANDWAVHQVASTANFAPRSRVVTWFTGALNYQIEHHLFPAIAHTHYPRLAPLVRRTCEEFGVRYVSHPTLFSALRAHQRLLARFARPDAARLTA